MLWCVAAAATYGCVPETDHIPEVAALTLAVLAAEIVWRRTLPWFVHVMVAGLVLWSGLYGATGRHSAIVGALFAFWPAMIVPLGALVFPVVARRPEPLRWVIAGFGSAAAVIVSRTGALEDTIGPAVRAAMVWALVSIFGSAAVVRWWGDRGRIL